MGYALLPDQWAPLAPKYHWHWAPYVAVGAAVGAVALTDRVPAAVRWALWLMLGAAAGVLLTPKWATLEDTRWYYVAGYAAGATLLSALLEPLAVRPAGKHLICFLAGSTVVVAGGVAYFWSLYYFQLAMLAAAALVGAGLGIRSWREPTAALGVIPLYAILVGGLALVGFLDMNPLFPAEGMLLVPLAPLALWLVAAGPLARRSGWAAVGVQFGVVIIASLIGLAALWAGQHFGQ